MEDGGYFVGSFPIRKSAIGNAKFPASRSSILCLSPGFFVPRILVLRIPSLDGLGFDKAGDLRADMTALHSITRLLYHHIVESQEKSTRPRGYKMSLPGAQRSAAKARVAGRAAGPESVPCATTRVKISFAWPPMSARPCAEGGRITVPSVYIPANPGSVGAPLVGTLAEGRHEACPYVAVERLAPDWGEGARFRFFPPGNLETCLSPVSYETRRRAERFPAWPWCPAKNRETW